MPKRILVAYDGTPQSEKALSFAIDEWGSHELTLLYVINPVDASDGFGAGGPGAAEEWFERAKADAESLLLEATESRDHPLHTRVEVGRPPQTIVEVARGDVDGDGGDEADRPYDLLVIGSHGRTGVSRILLGSVAEKVIRDSPVPVTVVR